MKLIVQLGLLLASTMALCGCLPEERIWWSPKGDRAIVLIADRLHLAQADGIPGPALMENASMEKTLIKTVSWLPDGSGFICQRTRTLPRWEEVLALIPPDEAQAVDQIMPAALPLLEAAAKLSHNSKDVSAIASSLPLSDSYKGRFTAAMRRWFEREPATVEKALLSAPEAGKVILEALQKDAGHEVSELCVFMLDAAQFAPPQTLARCLLMPPLLPRVSPVLRAVAFLKLAEDEESATLEIMPLDGRAGFTAARNVSAAFDWMPDGRTLVFMAPVGGQGEKLQSIHRLTVLQENGSPMLPRVQAAQDGSMHVVEGPKRLKEPETLATVVALNSPALQVLADGRILFASQSMTLPSLGTGEELEPRLYLISTDGKSVLPVPTAPGDLPANLAYFTASPDGKRVAIVEGGTDTVAVVEIDTGHTQIISPPHEHWQCRTVPAWKSATELTFAALHGPKPAPRWMLWSQEAGLRCISDQWPQEATADWLEYKKPEEQPQGSVISKPAPTR